MAICTMFDNKKIEELDKEILDCLDKYGESKNNNKEFWNERIEFLKVLVLEGDLEKISKYLK